MEVLAEIEREPGPTLVVCHGMVIRLAMCRRLGRPWSDPVENTGVVEFPYQG
jgi:probable phosphoglycerate mutase